MFDDSDITEVAHLEPFLDATEVFDLGFQGTRRERAQWIYERLARFEYRRLKRKQKGILVRYLRAGAQCSEPQLDRYIRAYKRGKKLCLSYRRHCFDPIYTRQDAELLAETDDIHAGEHGKLNGMAMQEICVQEYREGKGNPLYGRLASASVATIYRLRCTPRYRERSRSISKTKPVQRSIGIRRKPEPNGEPGYLRVDTVHQGDYEQSKGVYHLNIVDEVLQWEIPVSVEELAMSTVGNALEEAMALFPFVLQNLHSDPGGEFINQVVADLLKRLVIVQTKSRPRKCGDNALVECKNGAVIRKHLGYAHIPQPFAERINAFYRDHFIPYLNFHRPCLFPTVIVDAKGKEKRIYKRKDCMTPYRKFLSLGKPEQYLKPGWTLERLATMANEKTPNQAAIDMQRAKRALAKIIADAFGNFTASNVEASTVIATPKRRAQRKCECRNAKRP